MVYAGFWRRFCAHLLDGFIVGGIIGVLLIPLTVTLGVSAGMEKARKQESTPAITHKITPMANDYTTTYPEDTAAPAPAATAPDIAATPPAPADDMSDAAPFAHHSLIEEDKDSIRYDDESNKEEKAMQTIVLLFYPLMFLVAAIYHTLFVASRLQATPGKIIMGCIVVTADGKRLTKMNALGRHLACAISGCTLFIGYFMAGWTSQKTALHDIIASTRVVRTKHNEPIIATKSDA